MTHTGVHQRRAISGDAERDRAARQGLQHQGAPELRRLRGEGLGGRVLWGMWGEGRVEGGEGWVVEGARRKGERLRGKGGREHEGGGPLQSLTPEPLQP
eukprot:503024-Rhodomonas_salina.1